MSVRNLYISLLYVNVCKMFGIYNCGRSVLIDCISSTMSIEGIPELVVELARARYML
jgi:hypothetical protein